jgi:hypothetical protein
MLFEFRQRVAAAIWPSEYEELKRATTTLAIFLHDAAETFMRHSVRRTEETYWADQFYKSNGFNPNYDKDLHRFNKWLDDCYRLITKAACAANWFADVVRRDINPMFFAERGKFIIVDGPFPDLSYRASIPEFGEDEKKDFPQSLTQ